MSRDQVFPVIIVGGGGCGLSMSSFLSDYGVDHILFDCKVEASALPKAHYLNQRTMETFRLHYMHKEIQKRSCPPNQMSQVAWATSLGGNGHLDRIVIHQLPCFGGGDGDLKAHAYKTDSAARSANLPLCRMEPILRQIAEERNPGRICFGHTVIDFHESDDHVKVTVQDTAGNLSTYRTKYLIGADGGRTIGQKIGVTMQGATGITDMVSVHFGADLSQYWNDTFFACHFINGECGTIFESGAIVPMGPTWGRQSEEWVMHFGFALEDEARHQEDRLISRIRDLLKIPDLEIKVHRISHWIIEKVVADKYHVGRVFLAGDAAHRRPPTTGLGLNTAIEDALNLSWKLAMVLKHNVNTNILDTYDQERRPVGKRNADWGLFTFENSAVINAAIGLVAGQKERNKSRFEAVFEDSLTGRSIQAQIKKMIESQSIEFGAHGIELGFTYEDGLRISDGIEAPEVDHLGQQYFPTTRPAHRLPHAWLVLDDRVVSTHDLVGSKGSFLLLTDDSELEWAAAAERLGFQYKIPIQTARIGDYLRDLTDQWQRVKELEDGGAILVRPDNFIAWRSLGPSKANGQELEVAFAELLGLPPPVIETSMPLSGDLPRGKLTLPGVEVSFMDNQPAFLRYDAECHRIAMIKVSASCQKSRMRIQFGIGFLAVKASLLGGVYGVLSACLEYPRPYQLMEKLKSVVSFPISPSLKGDVYHCSAMFPNLGLVAASATILLLLCLGRRLLPSKSRPHLPPGPPRLPFIGNLHQAPQVYPWRVYQEWTKQYGPVFSLQYGMNTIIMLGTYQAAHELLNKRSHIYSSRPRAVMGGECLSRGLRTLLMPHGQQWRNHQRLQASYLNIRVSQSYRCVQDLESKQLLYELLSPSVDFVDRYHRYSSSVIFALAYGRRLPVGDEPEIQAIDEVMKNFLYAARVGTWLVDSIPILNYLPKFLAPWRRLGDRLHKFESTLCIDNMTRGLESESWNWSKHVSGMKEGRNMSTKELAYDVGIIYEAGSDTTSMALEIFTLAMLVYPDVMKKAQAEVDSKVGEHYPGFEHRDLLPYMDAMIKEVLRWRPVSAGGIPHAVIQDDEYLGYHIPAGATVIGNHWSIHQDEDVYKDPDTFNPDRWIEDPFLPLAPFGFGRRICTGQHLALNSLFINMVRILWAFDITHAYETVMDIDAKGHAVQVRRKCEVDPLAFTQGLNSKPMPFKVEFKARSLQREQTIRNQWDSADKRLDVLLEGIRVDVRGK